VKKLISSIIKPIADFSTLFFPYLLIFYLLLFLLENMFPGFVSNSVNLNYFLIPVLITGVFISFNNNEEEEKETKKLSRSDYLLAIFFSICTAAILIYKTSNLGNTGIIIGVFSGLLVFVISLIIFLPEEKEEEKVELLDILPDKNGPLQVLFKRKHFIPAALFICVIIVITTLIALPNLTRNDKNNLQKTTTAQPAPSIDRQFFYDELDTTYIDPENSDKTPVTIMNAGITSASLSATVKLLQQNNFTVSRIMPADKQSSVSAIIRYKPEDLNIALYLTKILKDKYPTIETAPLPPGDNIIMVVLGSR
jgi:hypothetical protein